MMQQFCYALVLVFYSIHFVESGHILSSENSFAISSNRTMVSEDDVFELGVFNPRDDTNNSWYLGIWFKKIPKRNYVWVANKDKPLKGSTGYLQIVKSNIVLFDHSYKFVWSTNTSTEESERSSLVAELLVTGNFVLRQSNNTLPDDYLWQSFEHPSDSLLPGMKLDLGISSRLISWRDLDDPSRGSYSYGIEKLAQTGGIPWMYIWEYKSRKERVMPWNWNGIEIIGIPPHQPVMFLQFTLTTSKHEVNFSYRTEGHKFRSVFKLTHSGSLVYMLWDEKTMRWEDLWYAPKEFCDRYNICGSYSYCSHNYDGTPRCNCIKGSDRVKNICVSKTRLNCMEDRFYLMSNVKLPDAINTVVSWEAQCQQKCLRDCNCTAFTITRNQSGISTCLMWTGELIDMRTYITDGQEIFIRYHDKKKPKTKLVLWCSIGVVGFLVLLGGMIILYCWKRNRRRAREIERQRTRAIPVTNIGNLSEESIVQEDLGLTCMDFRTISMATDNFSDSNKLGKGGFGVVYKGTLDGEEIAVKRLSTLSVQGEAEFMTELRLIKRFSI